MEYERSKQPSSEAVAPARLESPGSECGEEPQHPNPEVSPPAPGSRCPALPYARVPVLEGVPQKSQPACPSTPAPAAFPVPTSGTMVVTEPPLAGITLGM